MRLLETRTDTHTDRHTHTHTHTHTHRQGSSPAKIFSHTEMTEYKNTGFGAVAKVLKNCTKTLVQTLKSYEFCGILKNKTKLTTMNCMLSYLKSLEIETLYSFFFLHSAIFID